MTEAAAAKAVAFAVPVTVVVTVAVTFRQTTLSRWPTDESGSSSQWCPGGMQQQFDIFNLKKKEKEILVIGVSKRFLI